MRGKAKSIVLWAIAIVIVAILALFDHDDDTTAPAKTDVKRSVTQDAGLENR